jgi:hypothetical protein
MSDIVDTLLDWSEYDEGKINDAREKAANEIKRLRAENKQLRAALEEIRDLPGEINTGNYNHDDAVRLNDAFIETYHIARAALEGK